MKRLNCIILATTILSLFGAYTHKQTKNIPTYLNKDFDLKIIKALGYNPLVTLYPPHKLTSNDDQITIYVHGWGESQNAIPFLQVNTDLLPGNVIGFNFKGALVNSAKKSDLLKNSFCQSDEIKTLIVILKNLSAISNLFISLGQPKAQEPLLHLLHG